MEGEKFWLVWRDDGASPHKRHNSHASASEEARRLAGKHPGQRFFVVEAQSFWQTKAPQPERTPLAEPL